VEAMPTLLTTVFWFNMSGQSHISATLHPGKDRKEGGGC
jgi:hypothetical protein